MPRSRTLRMSVVELLALLRVHAGGRLVEQEQLGLGRQRAGDLEAALVAVGQVLGELVGLVRQTDEVQPLAGLVLGVRFSSALNFGVRNTAPMGPAVRARVAPDHDVLERGHVLEQADVLERARDAQSRDHVRLHAPDGLRR